jgi:hypothetical protein
MEKKISNIVFTKNRPLQLDAYLESFYSSFPQEMIQTYVLYKQELFDTEYESAFRKFKDCIVIKEKDFHSDFMEIIRQMQTEYILFGIDDVVYFDSVKMEVIENCFKSNPQDTFGFSLRFSNKFLTGKDEQINLAKDEEMVGWIDWTAAKSSTGRYPFELCATVYRTELVKKIIRNTMSQNYTAQKLFLPGSKLIKAVSKFVKPRKLLKSLGFFYNPNTLESWCCRWCKNNAENLPCRVYFQKQCAAAIQVNMVNTSTDNEIDGDFNHTVEKLNEMYKQCHRFDIEALKHNKPSGIHCGKEHFKLTK